MVSLSTTKSVPSPTLASVQATRDLEAIAHMRVSEDRRRPLKVIFFNITGTLADGLSEGLDPDALANFESLIINATKVVDLALVIIGSHIDPRCEGQKKVYEQNLKLIQSRSFYPLIVGHTLPTKRDSSDKVVEVWLSKNTHLKIKDYIVITWLGKLLSEKYPRNFIEIDPSRDGPLLSEDDVKKAYSLLSE